MLDSESETEAAGLNDFDVDRSSLTLRESEVLSLRDNDVDGEGALVRLLPRVGDSIHVVVGDIVFDNDSSGVRDIVKVIDCVFDGVFVLLGVGVAMRVSDALVSLESVTLCEALRSSLSELVGVSVRVTEVDFDCVVESESVIESLRLTVGVGVGSRVIVLERLVLSVFVVVRERDLLTESSFVVEKDGDSDSDTLDESLKLTLRETLSVSDSERVRD